MNSEGYFIFCKKSYIGFRVIIYYLCEDITPIFIINFYFFYQQKLINNLFFRGFDNDLF